LIFFLLNNKVQVEFQVLSKSNRSQDSGSIYKNVCISHT